MNEKVGIERVNLTTNLPSPERDQLIDLTMTIRDRRLFHGELKEIGYCVGEGRSGEINEWGEVGTIFSIYKLVNGKRSSQKVGEITTFLENTE